MVTVLLSGEDQLSTKEPSRFSWEFKLEALRRMEAGEKARPYGLRGLTAQRGQASGNHAYNTKKRLSGYPAAFSTGTRLKSRSPRSVTNFVSHT
jgi:hypothetical protein